MYWYDYAEIVVSFLLLSSLIVLMIVITKRRPRKDSEADDDPEHGMERSTRDEYLSPMPVEVIRFGQSMSREEGLRHIEGMRRRVATDAEIHAFLAHNPEVGIDWTKDFIVVPPT